MIQSQTANGLVMMVLVHAAPEHPGPNGFASQLESVAAQASCTAAMLSGLAACPTLVIGFMSDAEVQGNIVQHAAIILSLDPNLAKAESQKHPLPSNQPKPRRDVRRISIQVSKREDGEQGFPRSPRAYRYCG
jgi:hypothetical protein